MAGRPTALTPEVQEEILASLEEGNYRVTAAAAAGVHRNTLRNWEIRGDEGEEPYASFAVAMQRAEARAERALLREVRNPQDYEGAWQAKAWMMERRYSARWCARVKASVQENIDQLTSKLRARPELHEQVLRVIADEEPSEGPAAH